MALTLDTNAFTMDEMAAPLNTTPPAHKVVMPDAPRLRRASNEVNYVTEQDGVQLRYPMYSPTPPASQDEEYMHACMDWDRKQQTTNNANSNSYKTALKRGLPDVMPEPAAPVVKPDVAVHIQRDYTDSGRRITTTYEFPNCLYVSNLPEGITEAELSDLCHQTLVCRVDHVHMTRTKAEGHLIAFVYLVYWEIDKLPTNMYNRLAEFKYVNFYYHPLGLPASTRLPPIHVQLARNKSQLQKMRQDKQQPV